MNVYSERLSRVSTRITTAAKNAGRRASDIELLAVSKQQPTTAIRELYNLGQRSFGENRVTEGIKKQSELSETDLVWHFIGPVQSNKTRDIARCFDWVQSVDREKILRRLSMQRSSSQAPLNVCLQVNVDDEPQKAGAAPEQLGDLAELTAGLPNLRLRGLMCIPALSDDPAQTRASFQRVAAMQEKLRQAGYELDTLSMGMSGDLEIALACGSTMVRIGTDLFGPRPTAEGAEASKDQQGETHQ